LVLRATLGHRRLERAFRALQGFPQWHVLSHRFGACLWLAAHLSLLEGCTLELLRCRHVITTSGCRLWPLWWVVKRAAALLELIELGSKSLNYLVLVRQFLRECLFEARGMASDARRWRRWRWLLWWVLGGRSGRRPSPQLAPQLRDESIAIGQGRSHAICWWLLMQEARFEAIYIAISVGSCRRLGHSAILCPLQSTLECVASGAQLGYPRVLGRQLLLHVACLFRLVLQRLRRGSRHRDSCCCAELVDSGVARGDALLQIFNELVARMRPWQSCQPFLEAADGLVLGFEGSNVKRRSFARAGLEPFLQRLAARTPVRNCLLLSLHSQSRTVGFLHGGLAWLEEPAELSRLGLLW
jgi:hypothetical protein